MISADRLTFGYTTTGQPIVDNLTHHFPSGSLTAVTGPSGCGKSTLLYVLALMLEPTSGVVRYNATEASAGSDAARSRLRAQTVGFVFQDAVLDPSRTVMDNVLEGGLYAGTPRSASRRRATELMATFGVEHRANHRPGEISGGQAQRVAICRALIKHPQVLLADEPTGNLDTASSEVVWNALIGAATDGATVVVATHDPTLAERAHHRLVLGGSHAP